MKKVLFLLLFACVGLGLQAQDPVKDMKKAARLLGTYNLDPVLGADKLQEAVSLANASINDSLVKIDPTAWQTYGDIFMAVVNNDVARLVLDTAYKVVDPLAAGKAAKGFIMVSELADKPYQLKDAMKALSGGIQNIFYMGPALFKSKNYEGAYKAFKGTYDGYALLKKNKEPNSFDPAEHPKSLYYSGVCAEQAGMTDEAKVVYKQLVDDGNAEAEVYEALINLYKDGDPALSEKYLKEARQKYPDNQGLLYSEINLLLSKGELVSLIDKLEKAILLDPNNISVYVTLGQVYDSQFSGCQQAMKMSVDSITSFEKRLAGIKDKAPFQDSIKLYQAKFQENNVESVGYFNNAKRYYEDGFAKDSESFDVNYSLGALWYNRAAGTATEISLLANDLSAEGNRKYDVKKAEMDGYFAEALPYFLKAKELSPQDENTKIALREIDARFSDDDPSLRVYTKGPNGGCYYVRSNGIKVYVDRSMCN